MSADPIDNLSDLELSRAVAVKLARWKLVDGYWEKPKGEPETFLQPEFGLSFDSLVPLLQRRHCIMTYDTVTCCWTVEVSNYSRRGKGVAETPAQAACIALLKAARAQKEGV